MFQDIGNIYDFGRFPMQAAQKDKCFIYSDVIVASSMCRDVVIWSECVVNAGEAYRHRMKP